MNKLKYLSIIIIIFFFFKPQTLIAQQGIERPKLVVGIVVDQMRWDYLYRFYNAYSETGFKRLLKDGFSCEKTFIPYLPTYTAAGHASVYTGSVPAINGIISNNWYNRADKKAVYCTEDSTVKGVGSNSDAGMMSPVNMWTSTVTDELRLATNFQSKVIGIAIKDRGAILPAGHSANAAYWYDGSNGKFISSTYYMQTLPAWVMQFNDKKLAERYADKPWDLFYEKSKYLSLNDDDKPYEWFDKDDGNVFPHKPASKMKNKFEALKSTPFGNNLTIDMAKAAIEGEHLGKNNTTDFIAISFSSTDYIGHNYGPNSLEIEDTYLRLDHLLSDFLNYLDHKIGKNEYLVFLTADHGVAHIAGYLNEHKLPGGALRKHINIQKHLQNLVEKQFNISDAIERVTNSQIFIKNNLNEKKETVKNFVIQSLLELPYIANVVELEKISVSPIPDVLKVRLVNGYNQKLSGDIQFILKPGWYDMGDKGATHGSWNPYDARIPLIWFGWNIKKGKSNKEVFMNDIAPTISALLKIQEPSGCTGKIIEEVMIAQ